MGRDFRRPARRRARWPLLGGGAAAALAGVLVAWAAANTAPTITGAKGLEVRPDRSVAVSLSATDADADPDDAALSEAVRLQAVAPAGAPAWLDDSGWSVPAAPDPTLAFEIAAPETAAPAAYVISAMATDGRGLSSTSQFELRVLAPLCPGPLEVDDDGTCAACPDHHLPNVAKTRCVACPADTERASGTGSCSACPRGELSAGGEACAPNAAPHANAGPDLTAEPGRRVVLDGTGSSDPEGRPLAYAWSQREGPDVALTRGATARPRFPAPRAAAETLLRFRLKVTDPQGRSDTDWVRVTVQPAGGGTDPEGEVLTYRWEQRAGRPAVNLADATSATASFTAPAVEARTELTFRLAVSDPRGARSRVSIRINVRPRRNAAPVANAGSDQAADEGATVGLDGTASSDGDDDALTYAWTAPEGVALSDPAAVRPTFTAPDRTADYKLAFTLTVNDGTEDSYPDTVMVAVAADDDAPEADAGRNRSVESGEAVTLSGSGTDPEGLAVTYAWVQRSGPEVELEGAKEATATFDAPRVGRRERLSFRLKVTDPGGNTARDDVRVNVLPAANAPPVASALAVDARIGEGATATLDGSASSDADDDPLTYLWTAPAGVALSDATAVAPTFRAPDRRADYTLTFTLTVNDGTADSAAAAATVSVTADDDAPTAEAGADVAAKGGDRVALDGTGSSDPEGGPLTHAWTQTAGPAVALLDATSARPSFAAPVAGAALAFSLVVNDGASDSAADAVGVTVAPAPRVALSLGSPSIAEDGGSTTVTASLPEAARRAFEVTVSESSPAVALGGNATLAFAAGATASTRAVTLSAVDDDVHTGNRTATVAGALSDGAPAQAPAPVALTVADDEEDGAPDFGGAAVPDQAWAKDAAIAALTLPAADGGDGEVTYGLSPALPTGLSFDPAARKISGTPSVRQAPTLYTYTATDADGDPDSLTFRVAVGYWRLTVSPKPAGGTVTGPGGISCGSAGDACSATVDSGAATLTATADAGYGLESWSGACASATGTSCALTLSSSSSAGASFGELPACNASATGPGDACGPGAYALLSWSGAHGACGAAATPGCGAGRMEAHVPPPPAACGSSPDSCASGDWRDGTDTAAEQRWTCAGGTGSETWTCAGSGGDWTWTCTGGGETKSCAGALTGTTASCSRRSPGADASCSACTDGHHGQDGTCHADHACGDDEIGGGDQECSGCGDGVVPNAAGTACVACPQGRHEDDSAPGSCHADHVCGDDEIGGGDRACVPCLAGKAPNGDRTACACGTGEHEHDDHACHASGNCHGDGDCGEGEVCWNGSCGARVDGGWTPKSNGDWGSCSETACGESGTQSRNWTRTCTNPVPAFGGADCAGEADGTESRTCRGDSCAGGEVCWRGSCVTPVDGGWTAKSPGDWGSCSATACGESGTRTRTWSRTCSDPAPAFGGKGCDGEADGTERGNCEGDSCAGGEVCWSGSCETPVDGGWSDKSYVWSGACSATACGSSGTESGNWTRTCTNPPPAFGGKYCEGAGKGTGSRDCEGDSCAGGQVCWSGSCGTPVDGGWTDKSYVWGACSATACGSSGTRSGNWWRSCTSPTPAFGGRYCDGEASGTDRETCHGGSCPRGQQCHGSGADASCCSPVDGGWTAKSPGNWGSCSATACGSEGTQTRTWSRTCTSPSPSCGGASCAGEASGTESKPCHGGSCPRGQQCHGSGADASCCSPVDGGWTAKSPGDWGSCSATACGSSGTQTRTWSRTCTDPSPSCGGAFCAGEASGTESKPCYGRSCPDGKACSAGACVCPGGEHEHGDHGCHLEGICHRDSDCEDGKVCPEESCVCPGGQHEHGNHGCHLEGICHGDSECPPGEICWNGSCCPRVDGGWSDRTNGTFGSCSATACGSEGTRTRTWSRTCTKPAPECGGASCVGRAGGTDERSCYGRSCGAGQHCDGSGAGASCKADHACGPDEIGGGEDACTTCPAGEVPNAKGDACVACSFGEFPAGTCVSCPTGCSPSSCGGASVCRCPGASCPQLWGQSGSCTATRASTCNGNTDGCGSRRYPSRCTTGSHSFGNVATESCFYEDRDRDLWRCQHWTRTCRASVTEVGCVYTGAFDIPIHPIPFRSPDGSGYERGYLLAPFQCGSAPDTCRVEIGDEVLEGAEGVEDRDDTDAAHRWACRSDTGEVRECSKERE